MHALHGEADQNKQDRCFGKREVCKAVLGCAAWTLKIGHLGEVIGETAPRVCHTNGKVLCLIVQFMLLWCFQV